MDDDAPAVTDGDGSDLERLVRAATAVAESTEWIDPDVVADAARYAREEVGTGRTRYRTLLADVAGARLAGRDVDDGTGDVEGESDRRAVAYARLRDLVERRRSRENDVEGLFE